MKFIITISGFLALLINLIDAGAIPAVLTGAQDDAPALSSRLAATILEVCSDKDFGGNCLGYDTDTLELGDCIDLGLLAYEVSSISVYTGFKCNFFKSEGCMTGGTQNYNSNFVAYNLAGTYNDMFASFRCERDFS